MFRLYIIMEMLRCPDFIFTFCSFKRLINKDHIKGVKVLNNHKILKY